MDPTSAGIMSIIILIILLVIGTPVAFAMGIAGFLGFVVYSGVDTAFGVLYNLPYRTLNNWIFIVIPLFILMGNFAFYSGITTDLFRAARNWLGRVPGGLGVATVAASAGFAAATGAAMASAAAMSKIAIPEMERYGYQRKLALGTVAIGGTLAGIIPPSVGLVLYGILTDVSIAKLLIAGVLPGIMIAILLMGFVIIRVIRNSQLAPTISGVSWKERFISLKGVTGILILIFFVIGSLYLGLTTPTEAAAVGAFGAFLIVLFSRKLKRSNFTESLFDTGRTTAMIMFIFVGGIIFSRLLIITGIPQQLTSFVESSQMHRLAVLVIVTFVYLILGMFLDQGSITVITIPVIFPVMVSLGFDPIWFGVFFAVLTNLGQVTPPVGLVCFVMKGTVPNCTLGEIFSGVWPFFGVELAALAIMVAFPSIATFLPTHMT